VELDLSPSNGGFPGFPIHAPDPLRLFERPSVTVVLGDKRER